MTERTLFIHAGGSKTGSSAIQNFLEFNAIKLESIGYAYENRFNIKDYKVITSGNGYLLYEVIKSVTTSNNEIDSLVLSYFGNCNIGICSSEFFADFNACNWKTLYELSVRLGFKLKILFFVRDVISYFQSGYDQIIKRHGGAVSFDQWVVNAEWQHYSALREIFNEIPKTNIYVLSYEVTKVTLVKEFLTVLGLDLAFDFDDNAVVKKVNRSLTAEERDVLIFVNNIFGDQFSQEISDILIYISPDISSDDVLFNDITKTLLLDKFSYSVDWVNRNFFNDEPVISVLPAKLVNIKYDIETVVKIEETNNNVHRLVLDWALQKLEFIKNETELRLLNSFSNAAQSDSEISHSNLPTDFSSVSYLLLNPDIRKANVNPVNHYIKFGKSENRIYRFPKKSEQ